MHQRRNRLGAATCAIACLALVSLALPAAGATPPVPADRPYVRMWTEVNNPAQVTELKKLSATETSTRLGDLTRWFVHFHNQSPNNFSMGDRYSAGDPTSLADDLSARGAMVSNYRNGSYATQAKAGDLTYGEAGLLESQVPLAIGTWWPGQPASKTGSPTNAGARAAAPLSASQTQIQVAAPTSTRPAGAPATWPYLPSRGTGLTRTSSESTHDFVSWVRIDDEIMRIRSVSAAGSNLSLVVDRGFFGTVPATHVQGSRVMSPVYVGSANASQWDTGLSGTPAVDRADVALRYGTKFWQDASAGSKKDAIGWIAGRIKATFGSPDLQGHNAVWLDVTSCAQYNQSDPWGNPITPWLDSKGAVADANGYRDAQLAKISGLRRHFGPGTSWPAVRFVANNVASQGTQTTACRNAILEQADGGILERWVHDRTLWAAQMEQSIQIQANNWPGIYWVKSSEVSGWNVSQYERFAYGSFLLTKRDSANRYQFGGMNHGLAKPDEMFMWDLGTPRSNPVSLATMARQSCANVGSPGTTSVYVREFTKGIVVVNPTSVPVRCALAGSAHDVLNKTSGVPTFTSTIQVGAWDAGIALTT